ncbi:DUF4114 domain-containing protein [Paracraurococcus ruber]|uniref:PEP-CTERM protein-sorting domain-containing protein n=1 Tax=Paracraurococcus ruber TaxID=77675 RepID=A0ABS1CWR3_9PROT|nr:DUF4114 domain-containing protein [Paracraurococcus ruber]MBK1658958.1 hypothetical protein [Paracraurococcus ruber]TDG29423.1 hypothetical protein E2C05_17875 [Paracraurococcus ruber]
MIKLLAAILVVLSGLTLGVAPARAAATLVSTPLSGLGEVRAIFVAAFAGDTSALRFGSVPGEGPVLFGNTLRTAPGAMATIGDFSAPQALSFTLDNLTMRYGFTTGLADPGDAGRFHAKSSADYADFGVGALPAAVGLALAAMPGATRVLFVGFEDRRSADGSDYDYNDLIFAFTNTVNPVVAPARISEPAGLALAAGSLAALALARRRRAA